MFTLDKLTKIGLLVAGAFGSYSLGMNNIANVVGVFMERTPFTDIHLGSLFQISGVQQLFLLGGISIAIGVLTYSKRVMMTVGSSIYRLSPITAFIAVIASSLVLFIFASQGLQAWLIAMGLPAIPLVPVSQSQGVVGAISGIGIAKGGSNVNLKLLWRIFAGWILTPVCAAVFSFIALFFMQNVFLLNVFY
jgi:inorganic phosphate transporter, PiT family